MIPSFGQDCQEILQKNGAARLDPWEFKNSTPPKLEITFNFIWEFPLKLNCTKKKGYQNFDISCNI